MSVEAIVIQAGQGKVHRRARIQYGRSHPSPDRGVLLRRLGRVPDPGRRPLAAGETRRLRLSCRRASRMASRIRLVVRPRWCSSSRRPVSTSATSRSRPRSSPSPARPTSRQSPVQGDFIPSGRRTGRRRGGCTRRICRWRRSSGAPASSPRGGCRARRRRDRR